MNRATLAAYLKRNLNQLRHAEDRESATFNFSHSCGMVSALWMTEIISDEEQERLRALILNAFDYARRDLAAR